MRGCLRWGWCFGWGRYRGFIWVEEWCHCLKSCLCTGPICILKRWMSSRSWHRPLRWTAGRRRCRKLEERVWQSFLGVNSWQKSQTTPKPMLTSRLRYSHCFKSGYDLRLDCVFLSWPVRQTPLSQSWYLCKSWYKWKWRTVISLAIW